VTPEELPEGEAQLFTVRVWPEELGAGDVEWRGRVEHVPSGTSRYFRDWETLLAFVQAQLSGREAALPRSK